MLSAVQSPRDLTVAGALCLQNGERLLAATTAGGDAEAEEAGGEERDGAGLWDGGDVECHHHVIVVGIRAIFEAQEARYTAGRVEVAARREQLCPRIRRAESRIIRPTPACPSGTHGAPCASFAGVRPLNMKELPVDAL